MILGHYALKTYFNLSQGAPIIKNPVTEKQGSPSYGLGEAGYDIRIHSLGAVVKPHGHFGYMNPRNPSSVELEPVQPAQWYNGSYWLLYPGRVYLAPSVEEFEMPGNVMGICYSKSTLARMGLVTLCTPLEPGWKGHLTVELVNLNSEPVQLPTDAGVLQIVFHEVRGAKPYEGKYQDQTNEAVLPR